MDNRAKKRLVDENIRLCKFGVYKKLTGPKSTKKFYDDNFNIAPPFEFCTVDTSMSHPLDTAYEYLCKGFKPIVVNLVSPEYTYEGTYSFTGFHDEMIYFRTNISLFLEGFSLFPLADSESLYTPTVHIIRNSDLMVLHTDEAAKCKLSLITSALRSNPPLVKSNLNIEDYHNTKYLLETIFQTAYNAQNDVLILPDFGCVHDKYPIDDIIDLINGCIYKYGHLFKYVIVSIFVSSQATMGYFNKFKSKLVKPQDFLHD